MSKFKHPTPKNTEKEPLLKRGAGETAALAMPAGLSGQIAQLQRTAGNRATTRMVQRYINTTTVDVEADKKDGVTSLTAVIGADNLWGAGSGPTAGEPGRIKRVGPKDGRYVGGHMLNQTVGGHGRYYNMIVQSENSNKKMNLHDGIIKRLGIRARQLEQMPPSSAPGYEYAVEEKITVNDANPGGHMDYAGERYVPASLDVTLRPYKQKIGTTDEVPWLKSVSKFDDGHDEDIQPVYHIPNVPPYPGKGAPRRGGSGVSKQQKKVKEMRKSQIELKRLSGSNAHSLTIPQLQLVKGIGPATALALHTYFQANQVTVLSLIGGNHAGFNDTHLGALVHARLV